MSWHNSNDRSSASLMSYFSADTASLTGLSGTALGTILTVITSLLASILLTYIMAWKIAVVLLPTIPVLLGSGSMRLRTIARFQARHRNLYAKFAGLTLDSISSNKTVAVLGLEHHLFERYRLSLAQPYRANLLQTVIMNFWLATAYSVSTFMYALAYWWGSKLVAAGEYSQTKFFIVLPALLFSAQSCDQTLALAPDISNASLAAGRLAGLIDMEKNGYQRPNPAGLVTSKPGPHVEQAEKEKERYGRSCHCSGMYTS